MQPSSPAAGGTAPPSPGPMKAEPSLTTATDGASASLRWLDHLRGRISQLSESDWALLDALPSQLVAAERTTSGVSGNRQLAIKAAMAQSGYAALDLPVERGGAGRSAALQALVQFLCGYRDLDLRDAATLGHAQLIARYGTPEQRARWLVPALQGKLVGIAATEPQGGSRLRGIQTSLASLGGGHWSVSGHKRSISRLTEASAFVVICSDHSRLTAVVVDAAAPGLSRRPVEPAGLTGWSWGELLLDDVRLTDEAILSPTGRADEMFARHFDRFRPLVAATALGTASRAFDHIRDLLATRVHRGEITRPRDTALVTLARCHVEIHTALLGTLNTVSLASSDYATASTWAKSIKAHGVDTAHRAVVDLAPLGGAPAYQRDSVIAKALADLGGLRLADGVHDELYRSAGRALMPRSGHPGLDLW